ncbi:MAG: metallophosphoesterase family protein [Candidatus Limnocylindrales bacterium]
MSRDPAVLRQVALVVVVFGATLLVLLGLTTVIGRPGATSTAASPSPIPVATSTATPTASGLASPSPSASAPAAASASPSPSADLAGDPVLVGAGDIADCTTDDDEATAALLDDIEGMVFTAGDNVYDSASSATFRDCYEPTWGRHKDRTRPAAGNHDWQDGGIGAYRTYFGAAAGEGKATWYAYDLGTWRVIVLDSNCGSADGCDPESPQGRWLVTELAATTATCTVAIWHHPRFSSGEHGDQDEVGPFWDALYAAGADVVINGHDHDYERFAPLDPDGREDRERGLRQFVVGTGGKELRGFDTVAAHSELRASVAHGVLALTLHDGSYDWQFIPTAGDFADRGTARCH